MYNNNVIIVFEGPDGSGKTTQCKLLQKALKNKDADCIYFKARVKPTYEYKILCNIESINNKLGREFPKWLKSTIIAYERAKQLHNILSKNKNKLIIIDKYIYSTEIYLKYIGIDYAYPKLMLESLPEPDIIFLFDLDPKICLERIRSRGTKINRNETEEFLLMLNKHLTKTINNMTDTHVIHINADDNIENIKKIIENNTYNLLGVQNHGK